MRKTRGKRRCGNLGIVEELIRKYHDQLAGRTREISIISEDMCYSGKSILSGVQLLDDSKRPIIRLRVFSVDQDDLSFFERRNIASPLTALSLSVKVMVISRPMIPERLKNLAYS